MMNIQPEAGMRAAILNEAVPLFVARGYDGISMREIAEACRLSKAGLYYHFKDKQDLFVAILDEHLRELHAILEKITSQPGSARLKLSAFVLAVFTDLPASHRSVIHLANRDMGKIEPASRVDFDRRYADQFLNPLAEILRAGISRGEIRPIEPLAGVWALLGLMFPFINQPPMQSGSDAAKLSEFITGVYFEGVSAPEG